ncbi:hypothetical protein L249_6197, partial [Ophiocordyceps polyrhachis-furcata BCC 54312]
FIPSLSPPSQLTLEKKKTKKIPVLFSACVLHWITSNDKATTRSPTEPNSTTTNTPTPCRPRSHNNNNNNNNNPLAVISPSAAPTPSPSPFPAAAATTTPSPSTSNQTPPSPESLASSARAVVVTTTIRHESRPLNGDRLRRLRSSSDADLDVDDDDDGDGDDDDDDDVDACNGPRTTIVAGHHLEEGDSFSTNTTILLSYNNNKNKILEKETPRQSYGATIRSLGREIVASYCLVVTHRLYAIAFVIPFSPFLSSQLPMTTEKKKKRAISTIYTQNKEKKKTR